MINIMDILGVTYKEDIISNLLVYSLNDSVSFKTTFLEDLVQLKNVSSYTVKAYTRIGTSMGIPDIVIALKGDEVNSDKLIIIENKLRATERYEQTKRYTNEKCIFELCKKVGLNYKDIEPYFIYLTLIPEQIPSGEKFKNIDYKYLIDNIKYDNVENEVLKLLLHDFYEKMLDFYKDLDVKDDDILLDILKENTDKEKIFIRFKNIMQKCLTEINKTNNVYFSDYIGKAGGKGRESFVCKISQKEWMGEKAELIDNLYNISENTFDIHVEASYDIMNKNMNLYLHYEVNPYISVRKAKQRSINNGYDKYLIQRNIIKTKIHNNIKKYNDFDIKSRNGSNQIAKIQLRISSNTTVKEFIDNVSFYVVVVSDFINVALK